MTKTSLHPTDLLQVTVQLGGKVLTTITLTGMGALSEVFQKVKSLLTAISGIVSVTLRNRTQGWITRHNIVVRSTVTCRQVSMADKMPTLFSLGA